MSEENVKNAKQVLSTEAPTPKLEAPGKDAGLSTEQLMKLLLDTQSQLAAAIREQGEAIRESRKPYVDPAVLRQKEEALKERQEEIRRTFATRVATKQQCGHLRENGTSNISWMMHSNNIVKGICGICFSEFDTRNREDFALLKSNPKAIKQMGRAGAHANRSFSGV